MARTRRRSAPLPNINTFITDHAVGLVTRAQNFHAAALHLAFTPEPVADAVDPARLTFLVQRLDTAERLLMDAIAACRRAAVTRFHTVPAPPPPDLTDAERRVVERTVAGARDAVTQAVTQALEAWANQALTITVDAEADDRRASLVTRRANPSR